MVLIYAALLVMYIALFLLARGEEGKNPADRMAAYLYRQKQRLERRAAGRRHSWKKDISRRQLEDRLRALHPELPVAVQVREYYRKQYKLVLLAVLAGVLLSLAAWGSIRTDSLLADGGVLKRNPYGQGSIPVELEAMVDGEEQEYFDYIVEERKYTLGEAEQLYREASEKLPEAILGDNESLEDVRYPLQLVTKLDGYPFEISWESSSYALVNTDGTVDNSGLEEGVTVTLTAHIRYEQTAWDSQMYVQVNPAVYTDRERFRNRLEELLREKEEQTQSAEEMILPDSLDSRPIVWKEVIRDNSGTLFLLAAAAAVFLYWGRRRELDQMIERRKKELLLDYPEIVNKLALYMGAGMTIRNAFFKMGEDYRKQQKERRRYVYEEILITCNELQGGKAESEAYDRFGRRCQVPVYMKLSTLLSQNLRKGSNDLLLMLRQEADNAFAERKNLAKKLGEEAGTKLLLPMMMMLCIVMVLIMIPAFFSFTAG